MLKLRCEWDISLTTRNDAQTIAEFLVRFLNKCERGLSAKYNSKKKKN